MSNTHISQYSHVLGISYPEDHVREPISRHDSQFSDAYAKLYSHADRNSSDDYAAGFSSHHSGGHIIPSGEALFGNRYVHKLKTQAELWKKDTERAVNEYNTSEELRKSHPLNVSAHLQQVLINGRRQPILATPQTKVSNVHHY